MSRNSSASGSAGGNALRRLFREVAKRVHPDLASEDSDRLRRERLMSDANCAFEQGDIDRLLAIFEASAVRPESPSAATPQDVSRAVRMLTIRVRMHLTFLERYDSPPMRHSRGLLAKHLLAMSPPRLIPEEVMSFFDELYLFIYDHFVDEELIWTSFGVCAVRWWAACESHVVSERKRREDRSLYAGFEDLARCFAGHDDRAGFPGPGVAELMGFLENERRLLS